MGMERRSVSAGTTRWNSFTMVVSVGPYRFASSTRSPKTSIQRFTSAGGSGSPAMSTCRSASKRSGDGSCCTTARKSEGTQCTSSIRSRSTHSTSAAGSSSVSRSAGAHTVPPAHRGTK